MAIINPYLEAGKKKDTEQSSEDSRSAADKVTFLSLEKNRILIGSKEGRVTLYTIPTDITITFKLE